MPATAESRFIRESRIMPVYTPDSENVDDDEDSRDVNDDDVDDFDKDVVDGDDDDDDGVDLGYVKRFSSSCRGILLYSECDSSMTVNRKTSVVWEL